MKSRVRLGIDRVAAGEIRLPTKARIAMLTNRAARSAGVWSATVLRTAGYRLAALLTPEHGLDVSIREGEAVPHSSLGGIPVLSLYRADHDTIYKALAGIDALIIDLPDAGCRYYTYAWTIREVLGLAADHGKPVTILERPNPLGGITVEGNLPEPAFDSPVCATYYPIRHGLTVGELTRWQVCEHGLDVDLQVISMAGWRRSMHWEETGLPWNAPSPSLIRARAALVYPGTCLLEGTNLSEGRGTSAPFELVGAPFITAKDLVQKLNARFAGRAVHFTTSSFTPRHGKWAGHRCHGIRIEIVSPKDFRPVCVGLHYCGCKLPSSSFHFSYLTLRRARQHLNLAPGARGRRNRG